jgi:hypothetical protein
MCACTTRNDAVHQGDPNDLILLLLEMGADPNQGNMVVFTRRVNASRK